MNIIIIGPQGSGKGTQALFLTEKFNAQHIEAGRILRKLAKEDTDLGRELNEIMHIKKELASDEIIVKALSEEFKNIPKDKGIILDGAPRRIDQIDEVERIFSDSGRKIDKVIYLSVSEKESIERISKRYSCTKCHKHFTIGENISSPDELCDVCNSPIKQREDDTEEGIRKRLSIFHEETYPVVEYYRKKGNLIEIDGMQTKQEVFDEIVEKIKH